MEQWEKDYLEIIAQDKANQRKAKEKKQESTSNFNWRKIFVILLQILKDLSLLAIGNSLSNPEWAIVTWTFIALWLLLKLIQNKLKEVK